MNDYRNTALSGELNETVIAELRTLVAPPSDAGYWDGLEQRILARVARGREEGRWWALSERAYQVGLMAAGVTLIVAASVFLRDRALERRMAYESVIEAPSEVPQVWARRGIVPDRQATLRAITDH
jgi:hypothetical protein